MAAEVICQLEMTYDGVRRYKGEIFRLIGARNDDALVRVGHVRPITADSDVQRITDDSGRVFTTETSREIYRKEEGDDNTIVVRKPGRPKGSRDSRPRAARA